MPKRVSFIDANDEFFIDDEGCLIHRDNDGENVTLILSDNVEDFVAWLTDEADAIKLRKQETAAE